jgi:hypothetical protein
VDQQQQFLEFCATRRPRTHADRGVPLPHAPHPEAPRSPRGPRAPRRTIPAWGSPRTAGPSAAPRHTRAGRGGWCYGGIYHHDDVTGEASPIKTAPRRLLAPTPPPPRATRAAAGAPPPPAISVATRVSNTWPRSYWSSRPHVFPRSCRASPGISTPRPASPATAARRRRRPPDLQLRLQSTLGEP